VEEEWRQLEEKWKLEKAEKRKQLEEVEKAHKAWLQEEKRQKNEGKQKALEVAEDNKETEKELSGSNKKVSALILLGSY
jgi:hypothetical protein